MKSILKLQIMICQKYLNFSNVLILLVCSFSWAQFIEINAELGDDVYNGNAVKIIRQLGEMIGDEMYRESFLNKFPVRDILEG